MKRKYEVLDLFCGGGGASKGYHDAGFEVYGVDMNEMDEYPYDMTVLDALEVLSDESFVSQFDFIHASPPCQRYSRLKNLNGNIDKWNEEHPDLINPVRIKLKYYEEKYGIPYIIENVEGAPLINPIKLCGTQFPYLYTQRPRLFESNINLVEPKESTINLKTAQLGTVSEFGGVTIAGTHPINGLTEEQTRLYYQIALGGDCQWMTLKQLTQCIPPSYTKFIGKQVIEYLDEREKLNNSIMTVLNKLGINPDGVDIKQFTKLVQNNL